MQADEKHQVAANFCRYFKIKSSAWPSNYGNNLNCTYVIRAPYLLYGVQLWFSNFSTEACCDKVYIYDGASIQAPLIAQFGVLVLLSVNQWIT